jgi:hypothetical protein
MAFTVTFPAPAGTPPSTPDPQKAFDSSCRYEILDGGVLKTVQGQTISVLAAGQWKQVTSPDGQDPEP